MVFNCIIADMKGIGYELEDNLGSNCKEIIQKTEKIQGNYHTTYVISGKLVSSKGSYVGAVAWPEPFTLEMLKKMDSISFTVLGDGNSYDIIISTTESCIEGEHNHFRKTFTTQNCVINTFSINTSEFSQSRYFGKPVTFNKYNIEAMHFQATSVGEFNLKIWDIRIL
jgi:hypothetical protein